MTPLTLADLMQTIADPDADPALLAEALLLDHGHSGPLAPRLRLNPRYLASAELPVAFEGIADHLRRQRQRRFFARIAHGWTGVRIVAQGDSWFQFPLVRDIVRQLDHDNAVYCLSAMDPIHNPVAQHELLSAVSEIRPDAVLISAGGSDLFGSSRLRALAKPMQALANDGAQLSDYVHHFMNNDLMPRFRELFGNIRSVDQEVPILLHSYAYAIPRGNIWLGKPLQSLGISDPRQQADLVRALIDQFHQHLEATIESSGFRGVHIVDCRTVVGAHWFDELHPNQLGFEQVANCFRAALARLL